MHQGLLDWRNYRYLRWMLVLLVASVLIFASQFTSAIPAGGSTWQGYVLGIAGAVFIVWLALLGIRKRSYRSRLGTLGGWASAHVYLGMLVLVLSLLHCAFQLDSFNLHTATFWLMFVVVLSGFYGLYVYLHLPEQMSENLAGEQPGHWTEAAGAIDTRIAELASRLRQRIGAEVISALRGTALGGSRMDQLLGRDRSVVLAPTGDRLIANTDQRAIIARLSEALPRGQQDGGQTEALSELFVLFGQRQQLLRRLRKDIRYAALLRIWLYLHIPCTFALLLALVVHVFVILFYW